jgi:hypothetical protein
LQQISELDAWGAPFRCIGAPVGAAADGITQAQTRAGIVVPIKVEIASNKQINGRPFGTMAMLKSYTRQASRVNPVRH